jgi:hypothetical protein
MPRETVYSPDHVYDVQVGWQPGMSVQLGLETFGQRALVSQLYGSDETLERIGRAATAKGWPQAGHSFPPGSDGERTGMIRIGRELLDLVEGSDALPSPPVEGEPWPHPTGYTSVWATLDRSGCNRLIKTVRRARDAAFGRDE